jgi:uncharacterized short protein YbdD (DUF466 family)
MKALLAGKPAPSFDETMDEHMRKHHPDLEALKRERAELTEKLEAKLK